MLDAVREKLREARVYATTDDGKVLSMRAGADLSQAIAELRRKAGDEGGVHARATTALVNGRTVRSGYKIRNGDVLTPIEGTALTSRPWVGSGGEGGEGADGEGATGARGGAAGGGAAEGGGAPDWGSLPVPWPWSLVGSSETQDTNAWLREAEAKHAAVATLAIANWLALYALGYVSLGTEPLASLSTPLSATVWALQGGVVALAEASALQRSTSAMLRKMDDGAAAGDGAAADAAGAAVEAAAIEPSEAARSFAWAYFVVLLNATRAASGVARWGGRLAMVALTALALHADIEHGIIHDFFELDGSLNTAVVDVRTAAGPPEAPSSAAREADKDLATNLVSDILRLEDAPPAL